MDGRRTCPDCHRSKPLDEFYAWRDGSGTRVDTYCKECRKMRVAQSQRRHPEANRAACRRYYAGHRDEIRARRRERYRSAKLSEWEVDEAIARLRGGASREYVAEEYGVNVRTVQRWLKAERETIQGP